MGPVAKRGEDTTDGRVERGTSRDQHQRIEVALEHRRRGKRPRRPMRVHRRVDPQRIRTGRILQFAEPRSGTPGEDDHRD